MPQRARRLAPRSHRGEQRRPGGHVGAVPRIGRLHGLDAHHVGGVLLGVHVLHHGEAPLLRGGLRERVRAVRDGDRKALRVLHRGGHKDERGRLHVRVVAEGEGVHALLVVEARGHDHVARQRLAVGPRKGAERAPAEVHARRVRRDAELRHGGARVEREVLAVPPVAPLGGVIHHVAPERVAQVVGLEGVHRGGERLARAVGGALEGVVPAAIGGAAVEVKGDPHLADEHRGVAHALPGHGAGLAELLGVELGHAALPEREPAVGHVEADPRRVAAKEEGELVVPVRRVNHVAAQGGHVELWEGPELEVRGGQLHEEHPVPPGGRLPEGLPVPLGKGPEALGAEVDLLKIVGLEELGAAVLVLAPDAVGLPDALPPREPGARTLRVGQLVARGDPEGQGAEARDGVACDAHRVARGERHAFKRGGHEAVLEGAGQAAKVVQAHKAREGLVHRAEAQHVGRGAQGPGHLGHGCCVVPLEVPLGGLPVDAELGRHAVPGPEDGEHGGARQLVQVRGPRHARELGRLRVGLVHERGRGRRKAAHVEANLLKRPRGGAVAAAEAGPDVLVGVHVHSHAVLLRLAHHLRQVAQELAVVLARPGVLHSLPGDAEAEHVEAPGAHAGEVRVGLVEGERAVHEGHGARRLEEALEDVRGPVGHRGHLARAAEVHAAEGEAAAGLVEKLARAHGDLRGARGLAGGRGAPAEGRPRAGSGHGGWAPCQG
mmetsp:Transcript_25885/g.86746  ORF Transcript_25885/g.86746 Transcript_25885/m.86746 type:complete len:720 (+) Transcript_25885:143-2302(+)